MIPERHRQIAQLFDAALQLESSQRDEFLQQACAGDDDLRREVESLLDSHEKAGELLVAPALEVAAKALAMTGGPRSSLVGHQMGGYQILSLLGQGGMGEVYCAQDMKLGREVALKVLTNTVARDHDYRLRFEEEARLSSSLNHVNIVTIYGVGEEGDVPYIAMEFVRGRTLRQLLVDGEISVKQALDLATQIADALTAAHAGGVVHRDLKPENVMVTPEGLVKVLDFGLAKRQIATDFGAPDGGDAVTRASLTHAGAILGTVGYMSPEQAAGRRADHTTDQFSFGAILYEMLAGRRPFERETDVETLSAIIREQPVPVQNFNGGVTPPLQELVDRCLAKEPAARYSNAQELGAQLRYIRDHGQSTDAPVAAKVVPAAAPRITPTVTRRRAMWLGGAATVAAITGVSVWSLWPGDSGIRSLAVLPFENAAKDADAEFLCYGLTNSLIRKIAGLPLLTVKRGVASNPDRTAVDPQMVGRQLGVDAIVTGSVLQRSGKVYITAELVDVTSGAVLWADRYDRDEADVALIQDEIASAIIDDGIRVKLSIDERSQLVRHITNDPEAYQLYMRADYLHAKENEEDYLRARDLLQQAVTKDKKFALAFAKLSENYGSMAMDGYEPPTQNWPLVEKYTRQAIDLDPNLFEAHYGLAAELSWFKWDWQAAQNEFEIASRSSQPLNTGYVLFLWALGRLDDAIRLVRRDLNQNPLSLELRLREADLLLHAKQTETAGSRYANIIRDEPADARAYFGLAEVRRVQERFDEAINQLRRGYQTASGNTPLDTPFAELLGKAKGAEGYRQVERMMAQIELENVETRAAQGSYVSPLDFARAHARLGNKERAFDYLDAAFTDRSSGLVFLKVDHAWDNVRSDPRFEKAVRRVGLP